MFMNLLLSNLVYRNSSKLYIFLTDLNDLNLHSRSQGHKKATISVLIYSQNFQLIAFTVDALLGHVGSKNSKTILFHKVLFKGDNHN